MITFSHKGDFSKTFSFLEKAKEVARLGILDKYGKSGVSALQNATPLETGRTSNSWRYEIQQSRTGAELMFCNDHINNGVSIAIILQYGHGTRNGGWVEGTDYINPALKPIFDQILKDLWKEI